MASHGRMRGLLLLLVVAWASSSPTAAPTSCSAEQADAHVRLSSCSGRVVFGPDSGTGCCPDVTLERNGDVLEVCSEIRDS